MLAEKIVLRPSAAVEVPTTEYGVYGDPLAEGADTGSSGTNLLDASADFVSAGIVAGDIVKNITTGEFTYVVDVTSATELAINADIFSETDEYEVYSQKGIAINDLYRSLVCFLEVSSAAADADDTLDVYIDTSFDGGLTWVNIGAFTQVVGNGGAKKYAMALRADNPGATAVYAVGTDLAAGATRQIGFGNRFRYRGIVVDGGGSNVAFTYKVEAYLQK